jgi:hypothetical protein
MAAFLERLRARGLVLNGRLVHPRIGISTVTGRIGYGAPALQNLPKATRLACLGPVVAGRVFVRADYREIEPRILLAILRQRGLIDWDPGEDLYRTLAGDQADRDEVKTAVNALINGGRPPTRPTGRLAEFIQAVEVYRRELAQQARDTGFVVTLAGRHILLAADELNHGGKCVNRVVQGTAADIFHSAVLRVTGALETEGLPADVAFLLFDEAWVEADPACVPRVVEVVSGEMEGAACDLGVEVPVRIDSSAPQPAPWPPRPAELAEWPVEWRAKWGRLANELQDQGIPWPEHERQAFYRAKAEMEAYHHGQATGRTASRRTSS